MTTTHTEILTSWVADTCVIKEERIDVDMLTHLLTLADDLPREDILKLKAIKKGLTKGCVFSAVYKLGKQMKSADENLGRLCVLKGIGLQGLNRDLRSALAVSNYHDVDINSAHPTLMLQLCEKKGLVCTEQSRFIRERKEWIEGLCEALMCDRDHAKKRINSLYFGYTNAADDLPEQWKALHAEVLRARSNIVAGADWATHLKFLNGRDNRQGVGLSFILQTIERSCLIAMEKSATKNKRSLDVLIHDGGLVRKEAGEETLPEGLLRRMEADVLTETGFKVSLSVKPMETSFQTKFDRGESYAEMKARFEKELFRVKNPAGFVRVHNKKIQEVSLAELGVLYSEWKVDGESFIGLWRGDTDMKTYERFVFMPGIEPPEEDFNTFVGFEYEGKEGDVSPFLDLIRIVCNHEERCIVWLLDYLAHIFQKPWEKPGVAVVVSGPKGSGKDTPFDFIGDLLGHMFHNTYTPENTIWGRFNGDMKHNLMAKIEEANLAMMTKEVEEKFKSIITAPKHTFENKGKDVGDSKPSYSRFIATTNNTVPIHITDDERRFFLLRASAERRGDRSYWERVRAWWSKQESKEALMAMLSTRDISAFQVRDYPKTDYYYEVLAAFIPHHAAYLQRWIEMNEEVETFSKKPRDFLTAINASPGIKFQMTERAFASAMLEYPFERNIHTGVKYYEIKTADLRVFLQQRKWWLDL
tara:strand:+ start:287 stop:2386 length:2100 start_codon:yes stop_codon:yes gene_type:complete